MRFYSYTDDLPFKKKVCDLLPTIMNDSLIGYTGEVTTGKTDFWDVLCTAQTEGKKILASIELKVRLNDTNGNPITKDTYKDWMFEPLKVEHNNDLKGRVGYFANLSAEDGYLRIWNIKKMKYYPKKVYQYISTVEPWRGKDWLDKLMVLNENTLWEGYIDLNM